MNRITPLTGLTMTAAVIATVWTSGCGGGGSRQVPITTTVTTPGNFTFTNFDAPGGATSSPAGTTTINAINTNGAEVGFTTPDATNFRNVIRNPDGSFTTLTALNPGGNANGINAGNTVVGALNGQAFALSSGASTPTTLSPLGSTQSVAFGINDNGLIVGQYTDKNTGNNLGFAYANGNYTSIDPAGAKFVFAQNINNYGLVTGFYTNNASGTGAHGFLYNTGTGQTTLIPDPSTAIISAHGLAFTQFLGINDNGIAVGYYQVGDSASQYGFLYNTTTKAYTYLDDPQAAPGNGVQVTQITGINDSGTISGFYTDTTGAQRGFIATAGTH